MKLFGIKILTAKRYELEKECLNAALKTMRNVQGAIETNQVVDKDAGGVLKRKLAELKGKLND